MTAVRVEDAGDGWPIELATLAVSALFDATALTPTWALGGGEGSLAHQSPAPPHGRQSVLALKDGFAAIAAASRSVLKPSERLREELGRIGRDMERHMPAVTESSGAFRGAIWTLGLLVASAARRPQDRRAVSVAAGASAMALMPDRFAPELLTPGSLARLRFGAAGARGEAQTAFPHVVRIGLPALRSARARGTSEEDARLDALMAIMSRLEDTSLLHRRGRAALAAAQAGARAVLDAGGTATTAGREHLRRLEQTFLTLGASPRGSVVLLSATLFLDRLVA